MHLPFPAGDGATAGEEGALLGATLEVGFEPDVLELELAPELELISVPEPELELITDDVGVLALPTEVVVPNPPADGLLLALLEHPLASTTRLTAPAIPIAEPAAETVEEIRLMRTHLPGRLRPLDVHSPVQVDSE